MKLNGIIAMLVISGTTVACTSMGGKCEDSQSTPTTKAVNESKAEASDELDAPQTAEPKEGKIKKDTATKAKKTTNKKSEAKKDVTEAPEFRVKGEKVAQVKNTKHKPFTYRFLIREIPERNVASVNIKSGMHTLDSTCQIKSQPTEKSKTAGTILKGKKIYAEPHNQKWAKVFRKKGTGYIKSVCL